MRSKLFGLFKPANHALPSSDLDGLNQKARVLHKTGDLETSAKLYREILSGNPQDSDAHYRYGNVLKDQGSYEQAIVSYDRAIALNSDYPQAYCNRAVVLGFMNKPLEALRSYDRAIAIDPTDAIAQCNRAILLLGLNKKDDALAGFEAAIALDANNFAAHFYLGALLQERKLWASSLTAYSRAIAINPRDATAHYNQGVVLKHMARWDGAVKSFGQAIALNPELAQAYSNRGEALEQLRQTSAAQLDYCEAIKLYDRAIAHDANDASNHNKRALLLQKMSRHKEALADCDASIALDPTDAEAWFNRGTVLKDLDELAGALESYEHAIAIRPQHDGAYLNRGVALQGLGRLADAIASYRLSLEITPDLPEARYNLALASLALGEYATGWEGYEWRWRAKSGASFREKRDFQQPLWLGKESVSGKTILLYAEQGLGDALQFCRYVDSVAKLGARIILEVPAPLVDLCAKLKGTAVVIPYGSALPPFDFQCPLMSLPLAFRTELATIPAPTGYLHYDEEKLACWQHRLGDKKKPRIGLAWSGNRSAGTDRNRHFSLSCLIPYLSQQFQYFCLQTDVSETDQATLEETSDIFQFPESELSFGSTAALCGCMDLVISVDTSIAHLSGALGRRTWVLLPFSADWRWLTGRDDSPWYRSVRLFRQQNRGDWGHVFERVAAELRAGINS